MSEYEARLKSFANDVTEIRSATGATPSTLMFAMMSIMLAKNKITERDVDIIFEVEKGQASGTMRSYFEQGYGDPDFEVNNEEELKDAENYCMEFIDSMAEQVKLTAATLKPEKKIQKESTSGSPKSKRQLNDVNWKGLSHGSTRKKS